MGRLSTAGGGGGDQSLGHPVSAVLPYNTSTLDELKALFHFYIVIPQHSFQCSLQSNHFDFISICSNTVHLGTE